MLEYGRIDVNKTIYKKNVSFVIIAILNVNHIFPMVVTI